MSDYCCPLCNSTDVETMARIESFFEPFGGSSDVTLNENHCRNCGISGDFLDANDEIIQNALDLLKEKATISILNDFAKHNYNFSSLERALELPQRTLTKWKSTGKTSAAGLALLRFLRIFPWLIEVADNRFDFQEAQRICINAALKTVKFQDPFLSIGTNSVTNCDFYIQQNIYYNGEDKPMDVKMKAVYSDEKENFCSLNP